MVGRVLRAATGLTITAFDSWRNPSTRYVLAKVHSAMKSKRGTPTRHNGGHARRYLQAIASVRFYPQICEMPRKEGLRPIPDAPFPLPGFPVGRSGARR
jgi:hypothetical protein